MSFARCFTILLFFAVGSCNALAPLRCAGTGGKCYTRTPRYTGPEIPCCETSDRCVFQNPKAVNGVCVSTVDSCLPSGASCASETKKCCPSLACKTVKHNGYPPLMHLCLHENCSTSKCSGTERCCLGHRCTKLSVGATCIPLA